MSHGSQIRPQSERADLTRARILDAAVQEFSDNGLAGARTEQIAEAAGVNKALLYYYFKGKSDLYRAAIESAAKTALQSSLTALETGCSVGERIVRFVLDHFDRIHSQRAFQSLMQQEMMRLKRGEKNAFDSIIQNVFRPVSIRLLELIEEGKRTGELIQVDEWQIMYAALGANIFYFLSSPMIGIMMGLNPLERSALELRRKAAIEFLGQTIFTDRSHGAAVAASVLHSAPMPESGNFNQFERKAK